MTKPLMQSVAALLGILFLTTLAGCASGEKKQEEDAQNQGLTSKEVSKVVNEHSSEIRTCYKRELDLNPDFETKINVRFMIGPDGSILSARPVRKKDDPTPKANVAKQIKRLETCVVDKMKDWKFPEPRGGRKIRVVFPFVFKKIN